MGQPASTRLSPVLNGFGGSKYFGVGEKFRFLNVNRLGNMQPSTVQRIGHSLPEKFGNIRSMLHLHPTSTTSTNMWQEVDRTLPITGTAAQPESAVEPGVMRQGSIIQKFQTVPKPGQSIESFKQQVQKSPRSSEQPPQRKPNASRKLDASYRRFSKVEEVTTRKQEAPISDSPNVEVPPVESSEPQPSEPKSPNDTIQRQLDSEPISPDMVKKVSLPSLDLPKSRTVSLPERSDSPVAKEQAPDAIPAFEPESEPLPSTDEVEVIRSSQSQHEPVLDVPIAKAVHPIKNSLEDGNRPLRALPVKKKKGKDEKLEPEIPKAEPRKSQQKLPTMQERAPVAQPASQIRPETVRMRPGKNLAQATSPSVIQRMPDEPVKTETEPRYEPPLAQRSEKVPLQSPSEREVLKTSELKEDKTEDQPRKFVEETPAETDRIGDFPSHPSSDAPSLPIPTASSVNLPAPLESHMVHRRQTSSQLRFVDPAQVKPSGLQPRSSLVRPGSLQQKFGAPRYSVESISKTAAMASGRSDALPHASGIVQPSMAPQNFQGETLLSPSVSGFPEQFRPTEMEMPVAKQFVSSPVSVTPKPTIVSAPTVAPLPAPVLSSPPPTEHVERGLPKVSKSTGGVVQRMWEEHRELDTKSSHYGKTGSQSNAEDTALEKIDLDKLAEEIFPLVKKLLDIETERFSS